jgi:hypothetical protein
MIFGWGVFMNKRVMICVGALLAAVAASLPALAYTSPDFGAIEPIYKALPSNFMQDAPDGVPAQVLNEVKTKVTGMPGVPAAWRLIITHHPTIFVGQRRSDGLVQVDELLNLHYKRFLYDPLGLVVIPGALDMKSVAALSISGPVSSAPIADLRISARRIYTIERQKDGVRFILDDFDCQVNKAPDVDVQETCQRSTRRVYDNFSPYSDILSDKPQLSQFLQYFWFEKHVGMYLPVQDVSDWKLGDQPWHSQQVSAALSATQKDQARSYFARGFDLFKAGDFAGARAIVEAGQKIDPGNYLAWFTLGEIGRSLATANKYGDGDDLEVVAYQHTIDLAPDSPEAALAKGYLDALR